MFLETLEKYVIKNLINPGFFSHAAHSRNGAN